MKNLLLCLIWLSTFCFAQQVVVTGVVQDTSGNAATSGYVEFDLTPQNSSMLYKVAGTTAVAPQKGRCGISLAGTLQNTALTGPCRVWGNDVITPGNSLYKIVIAPGSKIVNTIQNVLITGTTTDLSTLVLIAPQPVIGTVINASPLVTESVVPAVDSAYTLGSPNARYSALYVTQLSFSQLLTNPLFFANIPPCNGPFEGNLHPVVDAVTNVWGDVVVGGGAFHVLAYCDGTNWTVAAK